MRSPRGDQRGLRPATLSGVVVPVARFRSCSSDGDAGVDDAAVLAAVEEAGYEAARVG